MADKKTLKKVHSTPGIYFSEMELTYAQKSLGITRLGVAGETQKGPAFQPIEITDWNQFQTYFGGTSTEKFRGSQYPKYELPYIAKEYLQESQNLQVCRVLGFSGVNAGAAWCITAYDSGANKNSEDAYTEAKPLIIAILRSRGEHKKAVFKKAADTDLGICNDVYEYDAIEYYAKNVKIRPSDSLDYLDTCNPGFDKIKGVLTINPNNYGTFTLEVQTNEKGDDNEYIWTHYAVSLNPGDKNYIINVLGQDPEVGDSEIYVEELYDVALEQLIQRGEINTLAKIEYEKDEDEKDTDIIIPQSLITYPEIRVIPNHKAVDAILTMDESMLTRRYVGKRFLFSNSESVNSISSKPLYVHVSYDQGVTWQGTAKNPIQGKVGHIYTVRAHTLSDGTRTYYYTEYGIPEGKQESDVDENYRPEYLSDVHRLDTDDVHVFKDAVEVKEDGLYYVYRKSGETIDDVVPITLDLNNYKEQYRYASTPWVVSEMKGSATNVELTKLFRFHTISDGKTANTEVKISIEIVTHL